MVWARTTRTLDTVLPASFGLRRRVHWCTANTCIRENCRRELQQRVSVPLWQILFGKLEVKSKPSWPLSGVAARVTTLHCVTLNVTHASRPRSARSLLKQLQV